ncbi:hypothetical protein [Streptomyces sp. NPDC102437]
MSAGITKQAATGSAPVGMKPRAYPAEAMSPPSSGGVSDAARF